MSEPVLSTARLRVRPWDPDSDGAAIVALFGDPDVVRYIGGRLVPDSEAARAFLVRRLARVPEGPLGFWAVTDRASGRVIGGANLDPIPLGTDSISTDIQFGVSLLPSCWGRGLGTELGVGVLTLADALGLPEVLAVVEPGNARSHRMIHRLGFTLEGPTMDYYGGERLIRYRRSRGFPCPRPPASDPAPQ